MGISISIFVYGLICFGTGFWFSYCRYNAKCERKVVELELELADALAQRDNAREENRRLEGQRQELKRGLLLLSRRADIETGTSNGADRE